MSIGDDFRVEVDAMSIDIDSYDCAALREALRVVSPKMVSVSRQRLMLGHVVGRVVFLVSKGVEWQVSSNFMKLR